MTNFDKRKCEMIIKDIEENKYGPWYKNRDFDNYYNLETSYLIEIAIIEEYMYKTTSWFKILKKLNHRDAMKYIYRIIDTKFLSEKINGLHNHFVYKNKAQILTTEALSNIIQLDKDTITLFAYTYGKSISVKHNINTDIIHLKINDDNEYELDLTRSENDIDTVMLHIIGIIVNQILIKYINLMIDYKIKYGV